MRAAWALLLAALAALSFWAATQAREAPLTGQAQDYARTIATSAAATYVTLRTLNAFLSTAQEIQVEGSVVVASGSAQPLKVLEPIDDTVERVAGVVFAVMIAAGVLGVSLGPLGTVGFAMLGAGLALWSLVVLSGRALPLGGMPRRLASYGGFLALAIPLAFVLSAVIADRLTAEAWAENSAIIDEITASVDSGATGEETGGLRDMLGQIEHYRVLAVNISSRADELIGSFVTLLAVYIFKVLVLPLMLLGGFFVLSRVAARPVARR